MPQAEPLAGHHKYEKITDLGEGAFGIVQLARNRYLVDLSAQLGILVSDPVLHAKNAISCRKLIDWFGN